MSKSTFSSGDGKDVTITTVEYCDSDSNLSTKECRRPVEEGHINVFKHPGKWWKHNYLSWRFYVTIYAGLAMLVCICVIIGTIAAASYHGVDKNWRILLTEGSCPKQRIRSLAAHWFISGMGTYMLSASAYVMYCLQPPTREDIDKEHAQGRWLDIGAMSIRNLRRIGKKRSGMFLALGLSSPLLQLFFNSILFQTYGTNAYSVIVAQETFMKPDNISIQFSPNPVDAERMFRTYGPLAQHLHYKALKGKLEKLDNKQCIDAYATPLQSNRKDLVVITENDPRRLTDVFDAYHAWIPTESRDSPEQYYWICTDMPNKANCIYRVEDVADHSKEWTLSGGAKVKYCLSEKTKEHCKLSFSLPLCLIVIVVCLFKAIVMFAVAFFVYEKPLMTTGDAISSFITRPDPYTEDMCMASKKMILDNPGRWLRGPGYYDPTPKKWISSIKSRVISLLLMMTVAICVAGALFCTTSEPITIRNLIRVGFGAINRRFFIGWHHKEQNSMFRTVFYSNIGHAIFGCLYILFNNNFYAMIFSDEWARYAGHRKGLRVSESPRGLQRTVYFYLMPLKLAFPIMGFSCVIHTLISQTLFFIDVEAYGHDLLVGQPMQWYTRQPKYDFSTMGFSPLANACLIFLGIIMMIFLIVLSNRKYKSGMPLTSTCSVAISAAIHPTTEEDDDAPYQTISWGVTEVVDGVGHCAFSTKDVKVPDEHTPYV